ncbi:MAG TPA: F0F1 ATP synthase subunit B [Pirellulales bacterium]|jgi:F-type H+-transporting ATPase subunit b|nr:F0F1 ATP synthase subunit B [Pirellulales bacterium]
MLRIVTQFILGIALAAAGSRALGAEGAAKAGEHHDVQIGAQGASTDLSEIKGDLAVFTVAVFVLLLLILWKFAWGPISEGLEKRERGIAEHIAAAERRHEEAKQLLAEYERKLAAAQDEVRAILDEARRDAAAMQQEILAQARADATTEMNRAKREVEIARDQALKQLVETSANLAVDLAGRILRAELDRPKHAQLIDEAVARFPQHVSGRN